MRKKQKVYCLASRVGKNQFFVTKWVHKKSRDLQVKEFEKSGLSMAIWDEVDTWE